jgi:very-short-patch-repair endonuclease
MHDLYNGKHIPKAKQMRRKPTPAERKLWLEYLRHQPFRVRRQCPLGHYILDFFVFTHKLVIEVDGNQHYTPQGLEYDQRRTAWLEAQGFRVVRFRNAEVMRDLQGVMERLDGIFAGDAGG